MGPFSVVSRYLMCIIVLCITSKTMFFLRILSGFSPIVIMVTTVIYELKIYVAIFMLFMLVFSLCFNILGIGLLENDDASMDEHFIVQTPEYKRLGNFLGMVLQSVRLSQVDPTSIGPFKGSVS